VPVTAERRRIALGAAAVVVLIVAASTFWPEAEAPPAAPRRTTARSARTATPAAAPGPVGNVKLDTLTASRNEPGEAGRNPFRFQPKVVAPPPRAPVTTPPPAAEFTRPATPPGPPPLPPIPLKFIGVLQRENGVKYAVLTDGKSSPYYGRDGDVIDGRFAIVKIGTESIEMTYVDGRGRQVIRLTGQ
jgi:hypothetical protein